jgi:hypothetical protein
MKKKIINIIITNSKDQSLFIGILPLKKMKVIEIREIINIQKVKKKNMIKKRDIKKINMTIKMKNMKIVNIKEKEIIIDRVRVLVQIVFHLINHT